MYKGMNEASLHIGVINVSDRASAGVYEDLPGREAETWLREAVETPWTLEYAVIPDEETVIADTLIEMVRKRGCCLILTTGGTGPAPRDVTPEATMRVCQRLLPGFGEAMRMESFKKIPTAILSRQVAGLCDGCLVINLPGRPSAIRECLDVVAAAIPYAIFLASGRRLVYRPTRPPGYQPS